MVDPRRRPQPATVLTHSAKATTGVPTFVIEPFYTLEGKSEGR